MVLLTFVWVITAQVWPISALRRSVSNAFDIERQPVRVLRALLVGQSLAFDSDFDA